MKFDEYKITKDMIIDAIKIAKENERQPDPHSHCDECFIRYLATDIQQRMDIIVLGSCSRVKEMLNRQYHTKYIDKPFCGFGAIPYTPILKALLYRTIRI